ncbi:MAG: hypothetical protein A4E53_01890 [Pelotomaculum sp. PtaB.Bin104]|nr:MAG: hypothetical protein A4E53_01890 [Pelotomaculum sp. PtaB.Bin104]
MFPYLAVLLFSTIDHFLTYWEIEQGIATEANPLLTGIMAMPANYSLLIRTSWIAALLLLLWCLSRFKPVLIRRSVLFIAAAYFLVIVYHFALIYVVT